MDTFSITLTEKAFSDLKEIFQYIRSQLKEPETAKQQRERIKQACFSLANLPNRYAFVPDGYLREQGVRFFPVDNYLCSILLTLKNTQYLFSGFSILAEIGKCCYQALLFPEIEIKSF